MKGWFVRKMYQCTLTQIKEINLKVIPIDAGEKKENNTLLKVGIVRGTSMTC